VSDAPIRIGTLGAARIAPMALLRPARQVSGVRVDAVAARERNRAERFASKHGIPRVHGSYAELVADPEIDAIYNPLPNSHHAEWTIRALEAGKHVLCEKPLAANALEAEHMQQAAERSGRVLMEAFHWRYHPLAARMLEIVQSGELGEVRHLEASLCIPLLLPGDIRYRFDLAGGATMDTGCYVLHMVRTLAAAEPEVVSARALLASPGVDRRMEADLRFPDGRTGRIVCSLFSRSLLRMGVRVLGDAGELRVFNPLAPHILHRLTVRTQDGWRREQVAGEATYVCQLRAFRDAVRDGTPFPTDAAAGVLNMRAIDSVYRAAGLPVRG
jgi:predicted dehydrogenase